MGNQQLAEPNKTKRNIKTQRDIIFITKATEIEFFKAVLEYAIGNKQKYYLRGDGRIFIIILKGYMSFK